MEEKLVRRLMTSMKCESCGQNYEFGNIDVLGHREDMWFLRVLCSTCHTQCLVAAVVKEGKALEEVSDLTDAEVIEYRSKTIEIDDVLDMHNFLVNFNGDFSSLFGQEKYR